MEEKGRERERGRRGAPFTLCVENYSVPRLLSCVLCTAPERESERDRDRMDALWRMQIDYSRRSCGLCFAPTSHMLLKDTVSATILFTSLHILLTL